MTRRTSFLRLTWWIESITTLNATVLLDLLYPVTTSTGFGPDTRRSRLVFIWRVTTKTLHEIARRPPLFARSGEAMGSGEKEASDLSDSSVPFDFFAKQNASNSLPFPMPELLPRLLPVADDSFSSPSRIVRVLMSIYFPCFYSFSMRFFI
ncbi:unnamed protein product [Musa acuminata subsp. malaccensis]|uniref:(wild Malaysian banana) hypothetical protein n=1 Tax=Musa acuminata subsp. malaccensis TaxID=214687 RepID=A0A804IPH1_MUSAM|nr:unnamed protein product [Musa acuminata subsp. malaccensis]